MKDIQEIKLVLDKNKIEIEKILDNVLLKAIPILGNNVELLRGVIILITKKEASLLSPEELIKIIPRDFIGQGYGYKNFDFDWDNGNPDEIIYVPEYCFEGINNDGNINLDSCYTKKEFEYMCDVFNRDNKDKHITAEDLFDMVDWQHPSSLLDDIESVVE